MTRTRKYGKGIKGGGVNKHLYVTKHNFLLPWVPAQCFCDKRSISACFFPPYCTLEQENALEESVHMYINFAFEFQTLGLFIFRFEIGEGKREQ